MLFVFLYCGTCLGPEVGAVAVVTWLASDVRVVMGVVKEALAVEMLPAAVLRLATPAGGKRTFMVS